MAQLVQITLVLDVAKLTDERIATLGRIADKVAYQAALDIYGGGVEVDVVLQDGSLFAKITVIGALLLGTYHGVASYPDFKDGIAELCEDANKYSTEFVHSFLSASATPHKQVVNIRTNTKTPGKVIRLLKKLEKLDRGVKQIPKTDLNDGLATAKQTLQSITRDISDAEVENLRTQLEFNNLPPVEDWPSHSRKMPKHSKALSPLQYSSKAPAPQKRRLLYHNTFSVPPKR